MSAGKSTRGTCLGACARRGRLPVSHGAPAGPWAGESARGVRTAISNFSSVRDYARTRCPKPRAPACGDAVGDSSQVVAEREGVGPLPREDLSAYGLGLEP